MKKALFLIAALLLGITSSASAQSYTYDLGISADDISFSKALIAGQKIRIYARIHNFGTEDVEAYVTFFQSSDLIGDSQIVSARANGLADEVFVDFTVPEGSFNIRAEIRGQTPDDENASNDIALTTLFVPKPDADQDGIPDDQDTDDDNDGVSDDDEAIQGTNPNNPDSDGDGVNDSNDDFPTNANETIDSDGDGIGDGSDPDDDNDGCTDTYELSQGTQTLNPDSDGDGVLDCEDDYPLDPTRSQIAPAPKPTTTTTETNNPSDSSSDDNEESAIESEPEVLVQEVNLGDYSSNFPSGSKVYIRTTRTDWDTYQFEPELEGFFSANLGYRWDFGDGEVVSGDVVEHSFKGPGDYTVTLNITDSERGVVEANIPISISFFNLSNIKFIGLLLGLLLVVILLTLSLLSKRRQYEITE